jgi:hypothetical protein
MLYQIIEDCSPYYIRFIWDGLHEFINFVTDQPLIDNNKTIYNGYYDHCNYDLDIAEKILNKLPINDVIPLMKRRVTIFDTPPSGGCGIHKDGPNIRMGINIPIQILDSDCVTSWYADDTFDNYPLHSDVAYTRNVFPNFKLMNKFIPLKTMIAVPNEAILFNTEIYHAWSNSNSKNHRKILTLRSVDPGNIYFEDARKILFNY